MGYKDICLKCRKAFSRGTNYTTPRLEKCVDCGSKTYDVNHKFRPPKKSQIKKWEVVAYLVQNGLRYEYLYKYIEPGVLHQQNGIYPETMREAKELVEKFKKKELIHFI